MSVLILDDDQMRHYWFQQAHLNGEMYRTHSYSVSDAIRQLSESDYNLIFLDHDLGTEPAVGRDVAKWLIEHPTRSSSATIICHSVNIVSGPKIERELQEAGREAKWIPFSILVKIS